MRPNPLRRLAGVADCPHTTVEFTGNVFNQRLVAIDLDVTEETIRKAELVCKQLHDHVIWLRLEQWINDFLTPLD